MLHWFLQAQPATLASLVGTLSAAKLGSAQRARARPAFTNAGPPEPPAVSHARPAWAAPLAAALWDAAAAPADLAVPLEPRCMGCTHAGVFAVCDGCAERWLQQAVKCTAFCWNIVRLSSGLSWFALAMRSKLMHNHQLWLPTNAGSIARRWNGGAAAADAAALAERCATSALAAARGAKLGAAEAAAAVDTLLSAVVAAGGGASQASAAALALQCAEQSASEHLAIRYGWAAFSAVLLAHME